MSIVEKTKEDLIQPFISKTVKQPVPEGSRVYQGTWSKLLVNMGFNDWLGMSNETDARKDAFIEHVKWDIAHRNYNILKPCISIDAPYNEKEQRLHYTVDLFGDGREIRKSHIHINQGDYLLFYMRMRKTKRKAALIQRIALANVGLLVPFIEVDSISYEKQPTKVKAYYTIRV